MLDAFEDFRKQIQSHRKLQKVIEFTGSGFLYGCVFGGIVSGFEGARESPATQRLRGAFHHAKAEIPKSGGRIALISLLIQSSSFFISAVRAKEDYWNVALAAPIAGALVHARRGPSAALNGAFTFGTVGFILIGYNKAESKLKQHNTPTEKVLEEVSFAEEFE